MACVHKKSVLITGASHGIGKACAFAFAHAGYRVAVNYCHSEEQAKKLVEELSQNGMEAMAVKADVSDSEQVRLMYDQIHDQYGPIDVLVNNAGIAMQKLITDMTDEDWRKLFSINVDGMFYCIREGLPDMIRRHQGSIVNISSMWGVVGASCEVGYSAAKSAVIGLTKALAKEVGPSGITVNCVAPGVIQTKMNDALSSETMEALREETPLEKLGTVQDVAQAVLFLASQKASFITGQVLNVNGGLVIT
jgi:3-oxoacyl-[acyl-carrier protein] reductase